jgi:hypothetical protein
MSRFKAADAEENVACNLIPMIDIMFLLLLFFMLSADMTTRVAEDMLLPVADQVKEDAKKGENPSTTLNLVKDEKTGEWVIKEVGTAYTSSRSSRVCSSSRRWNRSRTRRRVRSSRRSARSCCARKGTAPTARCSA